MKTVEKQPLQFWWTWKGQQSDNSAKTNILDSLRSQRPLRATSQKTPSCGLHENITKQFEKLSSASTPVSSKTPYRKWQMGHTTLLETRQPFMQSGKLCPGSTWASSERDQRRSGISACKNMKAPGKSWWKKRTYSHQESSSSLNSTLTLTQLPHHCPLRQTSFYNAP